MSSGSEQVTLWREGIAKKSKRNLSEHRKALFMPYFGGEPLEINLTSKRDKKQIFTRLNVAYSSIYLDEPPGQWRPTSSLCGLNHWVQATLRSLRPGETHKEIVQSPSAPRQP